MKKNKLILIGIAMVLSMSFALASPTFAFDASSCPKGSMYYDWTHAAELGLDQSKLTKPKGVDDPSKLTTIADCNLPSSSDDYDIVDKIKTIINVMVGAVGVIAVAVIVIGGILYTTSTGDAAKVKRAQQAILYGIVGLIVAILAYAIVNFVLRSVF